jgi:hypothetical protein
MTKIDIVRKAFSFDTPDEIKWSYMADDYMATDLSGGPTADRKTWIAMSEIFKASFPDIGFDFDELYQDGDDVIISGYFTGTFMHDLDLSALNMGVIKATGKKFKITPGKSRISFKGDKIYRNQQMSGGMEDFVAQLRNGNK